MSDIRPITHELQLGQQLNHLVHAKRRADFAMLLAMMSDNVLDQAQFQLEQEIELPQVKDEEKLLRAEFGLPESTQSLVGSEVDINKNRVQNTLLTQAKVTSAKLAHYMSPEAITLKDDFTHIDEDVVANCSVHSIAKMAVASQQQSPPEPLQTDETKLHEWLEKFDAEKPIRLIQHHN